VRTILKGTEADTLELDGTLPAAARASIPAQLEVAAGPLRVNVLFFAMRGLRMRGVPWPTFDYREALWRIAVELDGEPGWLAVACDLDSPMIRAFGRRLVRYPTRVARFNGRWSVEAAGGAFSTRVIEGAESPEAVPARRTFVRDGGRVYEIPWEEIAAPERHVARVEVLSDSLSEPTFSRPVTWASSGLVHRGRIHQCGIARRASARRS
jgi:hypothetical protein